MHDFNCTDADNMNFDLIAEGTRYLKESPEGVDMMCRIMEDMRNESLEAGRQEGRQEGLKEGAINAAKKMIADGTLPLEKIAEFAGLSLEETKKLKA